MEQKRLFHNASLCDGCGLCQLACSLERCQQWNHYQSRIKIVSDIDKKAFYAVFCAQCEQAPCITTCLMNTIFKDESRKITMRDLGRCIGCRACELACPFDAATFDAIQEKVVNCDLCGGQPACVEICPRNALSFEYPGCKLDKSRQQAASSRIELHLLAASESPVREADGPCT